MRISSGLSPWSVGHRVSQQRPALYSAGRRAGVTQAGRDVWNRAGGATSGGTVGEVRIPAARTRVKPGWTLSRTTLPDQQLAGRYAGRSGPVCRRPRKSCSPNWAISQKRGLETAARISRLYRGCIRLAAQECVVQSWACSSWTAAGLSRRLSGFNQPIPPLAHSFGPRPCRRKACCRRPRGLRVSRLSQRG